MNAAGSKRLYIRYLSNVIRKWSSSAGVNNMNENPAFQVEGHIRAMILTILRIRQRILTQAWSFWLKNTGVKHDYETDVRMILYRYIPPDEYRTELEIEVIFHWIKQVKDLDPTGIANTIFLCKKKAVIYAALQQLRLEFYEAGETVLFQADIPRPEDGHFTIFRGEVDVLQFPDESVPLMKLLYFAKKKRWDDAKTLVNSAPIVARIPKLSGFGELSTLTGVKRAATIRTSPKATEPTEIMVLTKDALLDCLKARQSEGDGVAGAATSEAIDFLRQSGLANRISPKDLVSAASCMIRRTMLLGDILYYKGQKVNSIFLVVSGEFLLDISNPLVAGQPLPFVNASADRCFHLSSGSILGEEGVTGDSTTFAATCATVSSAAVVFEAVGFGMRFLAEKVGGLRYSALYYRDRLCWDFAQPMAEQINPYTFFNSLRKSIAYTKPFRALEMNAARMAQTQQQSIGGGKGNTRKSLQAGKRSSVSTANHADSNNNNNKGSTPTHKDAIEHDLQQQKVIRRRDANMRAMDSRASFYLNSAIESALQAANNAASSSSDEAEKVFQSYPKVLSGMGLHRSVEVNKQVKKALQASIRAHAKDSILYEQLRRLPPEQQALQAQEDQDRVHAERVFQASLKEYYERSAELAKQLREEEELRKSIKIAKASSAISFFSAGGFGSSNTAAQGNTGDLTDDENERKTAATTDDGEERPTNHEGENSDSQLPIRPMELSLTTASDDSSRAKNKRSSVLADGSLSTSIYADMPIIDEAVSKMSKLEQYFHWMDNLNRFGHRSLLQQAEQTAEELRDQHIHGSHDGSSHRHHHHSKHVVSGVSDVHSITSISSAASGEDWNELSKILQTYGLTPVDMNIHWGRKPDPDIAIQVQNGRLSPLTPSGPRTPIHGANKSSPKHGSHALNTASSAEDNNAASNNASKHNDKLIKAKIEGKYKSYNPSSWREELIRKKAQEVAQHIYRFQRGVTPDNRRVLHLHVYPANREDIINNPTTHGALDTMQQGMHVNEDDIPLIDYEAFITSPDYFMQTLKHASLDNARKVKSKGSIGAWETRYMNIKHTEAKLKPSMLETVRTHLKEDLTEYKRETLLTTVKTYQANQETPFMRRISGKDLHHHVELARSQQLLIQQQQQRRRSNANLEAINSPPMRRKSRFLSHQSSLSSDLSYAEHVPSVPFPTLDFGSPVEQSRRQSVTDITSPMGGMQASSVHSIANSDKDFEADIMKSLQQNVQHALQISRAPEGLLMLPSVIEIDASVVQDDISVILPSSGLAQQSNAISQEQEKGSQDANDGRARADSLVTIEYQPSITVDANDNANHAIGDEVVQRQIAAGTVPTTAGTLQSDAPLSDHHIMHTEQSISSTHDHSNMHATTTSSSPKHNSNSNRPRHNVAYAIAQKKKATDSKEPSKALKDFEDFMKTQNGNFERARLEGRRRANQKCKFKLERPDDPKEDSLAVVPIGSILMKRLKLELSVFRSLYPEATTRQKDQFVEAFRKKYPDSEIVVAKIREEVDDLLSSGGKKAAAAFEDDAIDNSGDDDDNEEEEVKTISTTEPTGISNKRDLLIDRWQQFTIKSIVDVKDGERKTLPAISISKTMEKLALKGKKYRSDRAQRGGHGALITLPSKNDEVQIKGPPTYLELFKTTSHSYISTADRERIERDLKLRAAKMIGSNFDLKQGVSGERDTTNSHHHKQQPPVVTSQSSRRNSHRSEDLVDEDEEWDGYYISHEA